MNEYVAGTSEKDDALGLPATRRGGKADGVRKRAASARIVRKHNAVEPTVLIVIVPHMLTRQIA